jgi:DNA-binding NarL/FixJ family response regulator
MLSSDSSPREMDKFRILTVENDDLFRQTLKTSLQVYFPTVAIGEAAGGSEALQKVDAFLPDLIFMDIRLPGENGLNLTRKIKAKYKDVTVAMLTSYDLAEYREAAVRCGANCYITKDSMKWDQISAMVKCFQRAKDSMGLKPSCVRLASEGSR